MITKKGKTNWKYILIVGIFGFIVLGIILWQTKKDEDFITEVPEIQKSENELETTEQETKDSEKELYSVISKCFCKNEIDEPKPEEWGELIDVKYTTENIDLNDDGVKEMIAIGDSCIYENNSIFVGGITGNQLFCILQGKENSWTEIGSIGGEAYFVEEVKTNGYYNVITDADAGGAGCLRSLSYYKWDGDYYVLANEKIRIHDICKPELNLSCENTDDCTEKCSETPFFSFQDFGPNCTPEYECINKVCECLYVCEH